MTDSQENLFREDIPIEKSGGSAGAMKSEIDLAQSSSPTKLDASTETKSSKAPLRNVNSASNSAKRPLATTKSTSTNAPITSRASAVASSVVSRSITTANTRQTHSSSLNRPPTRPPLPAGARRTNTSVITGHERDCSSMSAKAEENKRSALRSSVSKPNLGANTTSATSKRTSLLRSSTSSGPSTSKSSIISDRRSGVTPKTSATTTAPPSATGRTTAASHSARPSVRASLSGVGAGSLANARTSRVGNRVSEVANKFGTRSELSRRTTATSSAQKLRSNSSAEEAQAENRTDQAKLASMSQGASTTTNIDDNESKSMYDPKKATFIDASADDKVKEISNKNDVTALLEKQVTSLQVEVQSLRNERLPPPASPEINVEALKAEHAEELQVLDIKNAEELQRLRSELEIKDKLQIEIDKFRQEIEALKKSLAEAQEAIKQDEVAKEAEKAEFTRSNDDLRSKLDDLQAHVSKLTNSHKDDQAHAQTKITQLEAEIESYEKQSKDLLQEGSAKVESNSNEELEARNKALVEENHALIKEKSAALDNAFNEAQKLKDEFSHFRQQLEGNLKAKESEIDAHQKQLAEANTLHKDLQSKKDERDSELLSINRVVEELQTEIQRLLQANSDNSKATDSLQEDLKKAKDTYFEELQEKESYANSLKDTIDSLKRDSREFQEQRRLLEEQNKREISISQTKAAVFERKEAEAEQKMNEMQVEKDTEVRELKQVVEDLQNNIIALKQNDHDAERSTKEENEKLKQETISLCEQLEGELKGRDELLKKNMGQLSTLTASVTGLKAERSQLREAQEKLKTEKTSEIEQLQQANKVLKNSESEIEHLRDECIQLKDEMKTLKLAKNAAEERMTATKEEATSLQKVLETFDKDSKEKEQQQFTALNKVKADLQSVLESHHTELQKLRDEHASELSTATESSKMERDKQLEELQAKYNALSNDRQQMDEQQTSLIENAKTELEDKHNQEISELKTRDDYLSRINVELTESSSATQKLLEDELKKVRTDIDTSESKHYEAQKANSDKLLNLQGRLDVITSEKQELLEAQNKVSSKMQEDHELAMKRITEDFDHRLATLQKEQRSQEESSNKALLNGKIALEQTVNGLEERCAQLKSSADMAVMLEEQSKLLKPRIHELEAEVASLNAELNVLKKPEMERLPGTLCGISDSKRAMSAANVEGSAKNTNKESSSTDISTVKAEISSKGNKIDGAFRDGEWSADMSLEGTMAGIQIQAQQLEELNEDLASESKRMIDIVGKHTQKFHTED